MQLQKVFLDRLNPLDAYSEAEFIARCMITRPMFMGLIDKLETFFFNQQVDHMLYLRQPS